MTDAMVPLKYLAGINERSLPETTDPGFEFGYVDISAVGRGELTSEPQLMRFADAPSRARRLLRDGDTIVSTVRTYLRAVWPVHGEADRLVASTGFAVLSPHAIDPRYLAWWMQSDVFIEAVVGRSVGVSYPAINSLEIGELRVRVTPLDQQRAIADYLDVETARIDALIAKKQQLIHLLEERIDAAITEVVGRSEIVGAGREPSVETRRVLEKLDRAPVVDEMITAFRDGQVTTRAARGKEGFTNSWTDNSRVQGVQVGDVIVHGLDGFSGAIGDSEADGVCSPVYHVCRPRDGGDPAFYGRLLRRLALSGYLGNFAVSTRERAVDFRNWDLFGRIPIPLVPIEQQREIGSRIRTLRPLIDLVEKSEVLAAERKSALITRVVTGDFVVPGAA